MIRPTALPIAEDAPYKQNQLKYGEESPRDDAEVRPSLSDFPRIPLNLNVAVDTIQRRAIPEASNAPATSPCANFVLTLPAYTTAATPMGQQQNTVHRIAPVM